MLYPIGDVHHGHLFLGIAEDGAIWAGREGVAWIGGDAVEALDNVILGAQPAEHPPWLPTDPPGPPS